MSQTEQFPFDRLVAWLAGELPPAEASALASALEGADEQTEETVAWLRRFQQATELQIAQPPPRVRELLNRRWEAIAAERRPAGLIQQLRALLTFDSGTQWGLGGARSAASQGQQRQLIFAAETTEVALNIQPHPADGVSVTGQIFPLLDEEVPLFSVQLLQETIEVAITATNDLGEFEFDAVLPGEYQLILSGDEYEVILAPISLNP